MDAKNKYLYKENQPFYLLLGFCAVFALSFQLLLIFGENTSTSYIAIIFVYALCVGIVLLFYRLKIVVINGYVKLIFGVGLITAKYNLDTIDANTIHQQHVPWYIGMGIRLTPSGNWVYNTKPGKAVCFKVKNTATKVCIVVNKPDEFEEVLKRFI